MAIDFPATPSVGTIFTAAGASWRWNGVKWVAATAPGPAVITNDVGRNLVHNPLMNISQRTGPFTTSGGFALDRWSLGFATSTLSVTQLALADADRTGIGDEAARFALQSVCTGTAGANDYALVQHATEDVRRLGGKTITVSFWARAIAGTPRVGLEIVQQFGTGGAPSPAVISIGAQAITLSTVWTRYVSTPIAVPSTAGKTLGTNGDNGTQLVLWQSAGSTLAVRASNIGQQSYTLQLWGVQLEIGSVATPLEKLDPQQDLAKCQRFYQAYSSLLHTDYQTAGISTYFSFIFAVRLRAQPTVALANISYNGNTSGLVVNSASPGAVNLQAPATATGGMFVSFDMTVSADL